MRSATAFAPASVGNTCVGFDVLGFAFPVVGDRVRVERLSDEGPARVTTVEVVGAEGLPSDPDRNTASVALQALLDETAIHGAFAIHIRKGIPLSAGMGGSAASAVAAVVAGNELLSRPLERPKLLPFALEGEAAASGGYHADNVAPSLLGGLTATTPGTAPRVLSLPVPEVQCVLVHPELEVATRSARAALAETVPLRDYVEQSAHLAHFITALHRGDTNLLRDCMIDVVVAPQRAHLVPGFAAARTAALAAGALGCSIAGAGPSVFAWVADDAAVKGVREALVDSLSRGGAAVDVWTAPPGGSGATVIETP